MRAMNREILRCWPSHPDDDRRFAAHRCHGTARRGCWRLCESAVTRRTALALLTYVHDCQLRIASPRPRYVCSRSDIEPDNDYTDTATTMSIDGLFFLSIPTTRRSKATSPGTVDFRKRKVLAVWTQPACSSRPERCVHTQSPRNLCGKNPPAFRICRRPGSWRRRNCRAKGLPARIDPGDRAAVAQAAKPSLEGGAFDRFDYGHV